MTWQSVFKIKDGELVTKDQMKEDLDYLVKTLGEVHIKTVDGFTDEQKSMIAEVYESVENGIEENYFMFGVNKLLCSFKDAHTALGINLDKNRWLPIKLVWLRDGIYIIEDGKELLKGDKILTFGGKTEKKLLDGLREIISAENEYWVKHSLGVLRFEDYLKYMGLLNDNGEDVDISIDRHGEKVQLTISLEKFDYQKQQNQEWLQFWMDEQNDLAVFKLDQCIFNEIYIQKVCEFFKEVKKSKISNIVVDLRQNTGGDSRTTDEFIKYLDVNEYIDYTWWERVSKQILDRYNWKNEEGYFGHDEKIIKNEKKDRNLLFDGKTYLLTSNKTFSGGNWFGVIFKDNNLGTIIGEPTGNRPSSYGDILNFELPNSKLGFSASWKKFTRPDVTKDSEDSLYPDIEVYRTIGDILTGKDACMEKVHELIELEKSLGEIQQ